MRYYVDENCIGCGLCEGMCPEVFHMAETGVAVAIDEPISNEALTKLNWLWMNVRPVRSIRRKTKEN